MQDEETATEKQKESNSGKGKEEEEKKSKLVFDHLSIEWVNGNPHPRVEAVSETPFYFTSVDALKPMMALNHIRGFQKLIYHDVYPGIDVEFTFHPERGIKYAVVVRPGTDASIFTMKYTGQEGLLIDREGNLLIHTPSGDLTDHAPLTTNTVGIVVPSVFEVEPGNTVSFKLNPEDVSSGLVIDPWTSFPTPGAGQFVPDAVGMDAVGNSYIYGMDNATENYVQKYNTSGVLQWTYHAAQYTATGPPPSASHMAVDQNGTCYVPSPTYYNNALGNQYAMISLTSAGALSYFWNNDANANIHEIWNVSMTCNPFGLIVSGSYNSDNVSWASTVNPANGHLTGAGSNDVNYGENYCGCVAPNGNYYCLVADNNAVVTGSNGYVVGYTVTGSTLGVAFHTSTGYKYYDTNSKAGPNTVTSNGIAAGCNALYTSDGYNLDKRSLANGSLISHVIIPGGGNGLGGDGTAADGNVNSGIQVDIACGLVYVGSLNNVYVYDLNLNPVHTYAGLPGIVYDIALSPSLGLVSFCGATAANVAFVAQYPTQVCVNPIGMTHVNASCGSPNGTATANPSFCSGSYNYLWSPGGQTTQTATGLTAGLYTVQVTTGSSCTVITDTVTVFAAPGGLSVAPSSANSTCGNANGTATANASAGNPPYTYSWSPSGGSGATASGLTAGNYTCLVTDNSGCTQTIIAAVGSNVGTPSISSSSNESCNGGSTGSATATLTGGTGSITYSWSPSGGNAATASGLTFGTYTCTITDGNGCITPVTIAITQPAVLAITPAQTNVNCNGLCTGTANAATSGGTSAYTYSWTGSASTLATASGLCAGNYTCTVNDSKGCVTSQTYTITQAPPISAVPSATPASCGISNGSASVAASGGTGTLIYSWNPAPGGGQGTANATALGAGTYTVTVQDASGCSQTASIAVTSASGPSASLASSGNLICNGTCIGTATVSASGGTGAYTYSWSPSGGNAATASSLCAGTYTCQIQDANGCITNQTVTITQPAAISAVPVSGPASCGTSNGTASVTASGGTGSLTYSWNPAPGAGQGTTNVTGLPAGTFTVTVTDGSSCSQNATVVVNNSGGPSATSTSTNILCNGACTGSAGVTASGGTGAYTYSWSPSGGSAMNATSLCAGIYTCYIQDANSCLTTQIDTVKAPLLLHIDPASTNILCNGACNGTASASVTGGVVNYTYSWSPNVSSASSVSSLCGGTYTCTVTDANGCSVAQTYSITQPVLLTAIPSQTNSACNGGNTGTASVVASGGTIGSGYTYSWNPAPGGGQNTSVATGLGAGNYTCTITDANNCSITQVFTMTQPVLLSSAGTVTSATCLLPNGSATTSASGGSGSYTYNWTPAPGGGQGTMNASGLSTGIYTCTVTDSLGCTSTLHDTIVNTGTLPAPTVSVAGGSTNLCSGSTAVLNATGAATYTWSTGASGNSITVNTAGVYAVYSTNSCGTDTSKITLTALPAPHDSITGLSKTCSGDSAMLTAIGTGPFHWNTGATGPSIYASTPGIYYVTFTNGCGTDTAKINFTVNTIQALFNTNVSNGTIPLPVIFTDASSATAVSWNWNFGDGTTGTGQNPQHTFTDPGTYTITETVTDANGCTAIYHRVEVVSDVPSWIIPPNVFSPNGDGSNDDYHVLYQGIDEFDLKIYDRWGVLMAHIMQPAQGWDGRTIAGVEAVMGTYYYIIEAKGTDSKAYHLTGFLMLMRQ